MLSPFLMDSEPRYEEWPAYRRQTGYSPRVKGACVITFFFEGGKLGVDDWSGAAICVTTWDASGEGVYVDFQPEPSDWFFSGGDDSDPKIMDDVLLTPKGQ